VAVLGCEVKRLRKSGTLRCTPAVVGLEAVLVGRVARAVVIALVKGQEPRGLTLEFRTHADFAVVNSKVNHAAAEPQPSAARHARISSSDPSDKLYTLEQIAEAMQLSLERTQPLFKDEPDVEKYPGLRKGSNGRTRLSYRVPRFVYLRVRQPAKNPALLSRREAWSGR
jgi:hypothetical protein